MSEVTQALTNQNGDDTGLTAPVLSPMTQADYDARVAMLDEIDQYDDDDAIEVSSSYWEAESKGDSIKGIFVGMKVLTKADEGTGEVKNIPAVVVLTKDGERLLGSITVVDTFVSSVPQGSPVKVTYDGKKGRAKMFKVAILKAKK